MINKTTLDKLREMIYQSLMSNDDMGLGESADAWEEADRIIREWTENL